jgi:uncharacterized protein YegL
VTDPIHAHLLLDTSASMSGAPLEALKQGLQLLCGTFISRSRRPVHVGLIGYDSTARQIEPMRAVDEFGLPKLEAGGSSGLGGAFRLLARTMPQHDPSLVYIFTDGEPTDDWEDAVQPLRSRTQKLVVIACGPKANTATLEPIVDKAFQVRELTPDLLFETFRAFV